MVQRVLSLLKEQHEQRISLLANWDWEGMFDNVENKYYTKLKRITSGGPDEDEWFDAVNGLCHPCPFHPSRQLREYASTPIVVP